LLLSTMKKYEVGFTLIELAMVLFIITLVLGGIMLPLSTKLEQDDRKTTIALLEEIKESIIGYTLVKGYIPCPDCPDNATNDCSTSGTTANDGLEDGVDNYSSPTTATNDRSSSNFLACATAYGNVPWATLGVPEYDAWHHRFYYRVDDEFADKTYGTTGCSSVTANVSFCLDSDGDISVNDETGASIAQKLPFIIVSFGKENSNSGTSQAENQDNDTTFIYRDYSKETDAYDDLMIWVPTATLKYQMIKAGKLP